MRAFRKSAFTIIEYVFLIALITATLLIMALYIKRGLSGKWREVGDTFGYGRQYEPNKTVIH